MIPSFRHPSRFGPGLFLVLAGLVFVASSSAFAEERPIIEISPGKERAFHVAVQLFRDDLEPADPARAAKLLKSIEQGLDFNGVLLALSREAFLGPEVTQELAGGRRYDCADWTQSGANALVEGVISGGGGEVEVSYRVWDTARCVRLLRARLVRPANQLHRLGAALADDVVKAFTGTRGAADSEIAFISTRTGHREIYVMDADGRNARGATKSASIKAFPAWLPDRGGILYTTYLKDGFPDLFVTSRGKGRAGRILRDLLPGSPKYRGVFSPDGEYLAIVATPDKAADLFRVGRDGKKLLRLTNNGDVIDIAPSWAPDGRRLAFVSDRSGAPQVYIMDREGGNVRRLTYQSNYSATPAWSPDGRWIAYGVRAEGRFDLYLIDPAGEVNVPLMVHRGNDQYPSWSPDGRKVIFSSDRRGHADLYVVDVNSRRVQRLTRDSKDNLAPVWGPFPE
jgi:TolB protein